MGLFDEKSDCFDEFFTIVQPQPKRTTTSAPMVSFQLLIMSITITKSFALKWLSMLTNTPIYLGSILLVKIQQTKIVVTKIWLSLFKAEPVYEGRLKVILLMQVSSHDFEPTFVKFCPN